MSPATVCTSMLGANPRNSTAAACNVSSPRALITRFTPSFAKARAQARPKPLLAAQTIAQRPEIPKSMTMLLTFRRRYVTTACRHFGG
ncbi:hypothetical protein D3C73_332590 [compost metagenome]